MVFVSKQFREQKNLAVVYTAEGNEEAKFDDLMDNKLSDIGLFVPIATLTFVPCYLF